MRKGFERQAGLIAGLIGVFHLREELVDAVVDMREECIGEPKQPCTTACEHAHPVQAQTCEEQQRAPQREKQSSLANIGLHQEEENGNATSSSVMSSLRIRIGWRVGKNGGGQDGKAGFEKFGRLQGEPAKVNPAFRAENFTSGEQHQRGADNGERKDDGRCELDSADGEERGYGENARGNRGEHDLFGGVAEIAWLTSARRWRQGLRRRQASGRWR